MLKQDWHGREGSSLRLRLNIAFPCAGERQCEVVLHLAHCLEVKTQARNNDTCGI